MHLSWNDRPSKGPARSARLGRALGAACLAAALGAGGGAAAEETAPETAQEAEAPAVPLEKLLKLPPGAAAPTLRYGGATRQEWRTRFDEVRTELAEARAALADAQTELGKLAAETDQWQMSAPGLGNVQASGDQGPLSYRLHQEIRRQREEIARSERRLQELRVEANLAGVPREWMEPPPPETSAAGAPPGS